MRPRLKDVAIKAGVSGATVSHVINGTRFVTQETKNRVLKAMEELNYYPNTIARSLRSQKSYVIGLIVPDISNFFFTGIIGGIERVLRETGYNLTVSNSDENLKNQLEQIRIFNGQLIDGLIIATVQCDYSSLTSEMGDYPVIYIDRTPDGYTGEDYVLVNNTEVVKEAINYFIACGHERIGIILGLPGLTTTEERLLGYQQALEEKRIPIDERLIKKGDSKYSSGYDLTKELMEKQEITALFVGNNLMTIGSMEYLRERELQIPEELAFIGFDDYRWSSINRPRLSVIKQPTIEIGEMAASMLLNKIEEKTTKKKVPSACRLLATFVVRESC